MIIYGNMCFFYPRFYTYNQVDAPQHQLKNEKLDYEYVNKQPLTYGEEYNWLRVLATRQLRDARSIFY